MKKRLLALFMAGVLSLSGSAAVYAGNFGDSGDGGLGLLGGLLEGLFGDVASGGEASIDVEGILNSVGSGDGTIDLGGLLGVEGVDLTINLNDLLGNLQGEDGTINLSELLSNLEGMDGSVDLNELLGNLEGVDGSVDLDELLGNLEGVDGNADLSELLGGLEGLDGSVDLNGTVDVKGLLRSLIGGKSGENVDISGLIGGENSAGGDYSENGDYGDYGNYGESSESLDISGVIGGLLRGGDGESPDYVGLFHKILSVFKSEPDSFDLDTLLEEGGLLANILDLLGSQGGVLAKIAAYCKDNKGEYCAELFLETMDTLEEGEDGSLTFQGEKLTQEEMEAAIGNILEQYTIVQREISPDSEAFD